MIATETEPLERARAAASGEAGKGEYVRRMFSAIAPRYDLLNHLLSFNIDRAWRRRAVARLGVVGSPAGRYLDLCAGTLDVAAEISRVAAFSGTVVGADFSEPMLRAGVDKSPKGRVSPVVADALTLPLPASRFAGAIVGFGIRNVADLDAGLREVHRVLAPGGRFVILEFTTPRNRIVRGAYHTYFHTILPRVGGLVSGNRAAYAYLPQSVANFPDEPTLAEHLRRAGFVDVSWESLSLGIAAIHLAHKSA